MASRTTTGTPGRASPGAGSKTFTQSETATRESKAVSSSRTSHAKSGTHPAHRAGSEAASKTTTDHDAIRRWAEKRGGHPTSVTGTEHGKGDPGVLRLDFGVKDEKLHAVDWDAFFEKFEEAKLAFLYQDKTSDGKISRFHKFIHRH
jgi:hypothetical protein